MTALDRHRALLAAATPGPWATKKPPRDEQGWQTGVRIAAMGGSTAVYSNHQGGQFPFADAQLIAAAVNSHELLLDLWAAVKQRCDDASPTWAPELRDIVAKLEAMP